ncbi:MAG: phosphate/phosphite/phosphonate ABC transporter substrate-binding protein [Phototrophicaceae bacterium]
MNKFVRILLVLAVLAISVSLVSAQDATVDRTDWPAVFSFGMFAGDDAASALTDAEPLRAYLEAQLGIPVLVNVGTTYSAVIAAMEAGQVDAMMVGPFSYVIAEREANAEAIAVVATESDVEGKTLEEINVDALRPFYYSVFVTKKGNEIATLADLEGKDVAFVDPASTSGRNAPVVRLISDIEGLETPSDVDAWLNPVFSGSHPAAVLALINGDVQAATTFEGNLIAQRTEGLAEVCGFEEDALGVTLTQEMIDATYADCPDGHLVVIAQSAPIPNTPFGIRADLPESFKDAVKAALIATGTDQAAFEAAGRVFIDPSQNEELATELGLETISDFYDVVRDIAAVTAEQ